MYFDVKWHITKLQFLVLVVSFSSIYVTEVRAECVKCLTGLILLLLAI